MSRVLPDITDSCALFLDIDGTLLDLKPDPRKVEVPPDLRAILAALSRRLGGALALISGRRLADIDRLFSPFFLPAAGQHGAELRLDRDGAVTPTPLNADFAPLRARLDAYASSHPGIAIEWKGSSIAVHCPEVPDPNGALARLIADTLAESDCGIEVLPSRKGFDLKPRSVGKDRAIEWFMSRKPFIGRTPIFAGDDATDEDAIAAVLQLSGTAIHVGLNGVTIAPLRVSNPGEIRAWLSASAKTGGR